MIAFAVLAAALLAAPARAGMVTRPEHVRASARGLTAAERRAITVTLLSVAGDDSLGAVVRVTFQGDVEHYLGERHLSHALLALVLVPPGGGQPRGLIDEGSARFERVLRMTPARPAGVVRHGHQITFYIAGARLSRFARVKLKVFATSPPNVSWSHILAAKPAEMLSLRVHSSALTCAQLTALGNQLRELRSTRLAAEIRRIAKARTVACAVPPTLAPPPPPTTTTAATATTPPPPPAVNVVQTDSALSQQMAVQPAISFSSAPQTGVPVIDVNDRVGYQRFSGLGSALTDSAAWLIHDQLSSADQATLMQDLFGPAGIHLDFLRVPMAASDFTVSPDPYSYDDLPAGQTDPSLAQFSIAHDLAYVIPALQQALRVNPGLQILANPWSPPGWMKANGSLDNSNDQGTLLASAYGPLADYFVKFIQAYESNGVPINAITPQNEPRTSGSGTSYPGLTLPEPDEATFISQYLQPALARAGLHPKIYGNDLSWDKLAYADSLASGPAAGDLNGIAWHCYFGSPTVMSQLHQSAPGLDQIADECSPEIRNFGTPEYLISTLRNWASVVAVWNLALDPQGGPHGTAYGCPGCTGVVTIDEQAHTINFSSEYYQLGQVSAFVQPGAMRIASPNFVTYGLNGSNIETVSPGLDDVAFLNPDGSRVLIAYNHSTAPISFAVESDGKYFAYAIPPQAMTTFTWR
ncbi:MAG: glycoside hydrolase family 30 protein [Solirubrobacteraceae bacterium]